VLADGRSPAGCGGWELNCSHEAAFCESYGDQVTELTRYQSSSRKAKSR